jgi:glycerol-3-phosphate cytidylyltransferase
MRVLVVGVFDLFHVGHVNLLRSAREYFLPDIPYLLVGLITDEDCSYKRKSIIPYQDRKEMLESCKYVDEVIQWDLNCDWNVVIEKHEIDYIVRGKEVAHPRTGWPYGFDGIIELPRTDGISTTSIINIIRGE